MSIYISGVNLPEQGFKTLLVWYNGDVTDGNVQDIGKAVELSPHGRLGDLDEIWELLEQEKYPETQIVNETDHDDKFWMIGKSAGINAFRRVCQNMQGIIPADPGEGEA